MDVDNSFVDSHFESVPSLRSFSAGGLSCGDSQDLGGDANWASSLVALIPSSGNDFRTSVF